MRLQLLIAGLALFGAQQLALADSCWIHVPNGCRYTIPSSGWFQDNGYDSSSNQIMCMQRAADYQEWCGTDGAYASYWSDAGVNSWVYTLHGKYQAFSLPPGTGVPMKSLHNYPGASLRMQHDGNFVAYNGGTAIWATSWMSQTSSTPGSYPAQSCSSHNCVANMQWDGNLVVYGPNGQWLWQSGTGGMGGSVLQTTMQESPYVSILRGPDPAATVAWTQCLPAQYGLFNRPSNGIDFLDQTVCDDGQGHATGQDPGNEGTGCTCGSGNARKINIGEHLPYHKHDTNYVQISDSYRIADPWGRVRVAQTMAYTQYLPQNGGQVTFNPNHGGYSLIGADGAYIGIMGTHDQTGGFQPFFSIGCNTRDSWVLFPSSFGATPNQAFSWIASPSCNFPAGATPGTYANTFTVWTPWPVWVTYTNGKTLLTMIAYHYAHQTQDIGSITMDGVDSGEFFYFTREYGMTRWEAWQSVNNNPNGVNVGNGSPQCNGIQNTTWGYSNPAARIDCRDWSNVRPVPGKWNPANFPIHPFFTSWQ